MSEDKAYVLEITPDAVQDLKKIDKKHAERIVKKLRWVAQNASEVNHEELTGQWAGFYRWRIGDYRAIYDLDHEGRILLVAVIGHRREIYVK